MLIYCCSLFKVERSYLFRAYFSLKRRWNSLINLLNFIVLISMCSLPMWCSSTHYKQHNLLSLWHCVDTHNCKIDESLCFWHFNVVNNSWILYWPLSILLFFFTLSKYIKWFIICYLFFQINYQFIVFLIFLNKSSILKSCLFSN